MYSFTSLAVPSLIFAVNFQGNLASYLQKKGRVSPSKALRFALEIARGMNYLHECKPEPILHCDLKPKNILLDFGGQLKVAGFGVIRLSTISPDKAKLAHPDAIDRSSYYVAPEIYKDEIFNRSVDVYSFGLMLYEMMEGSPPFSSKSPDEVAKLICLEGKRPTFKSKSKAFPIEIKELIEECWHPDCVVRPTFSEIIVRLDKIVMNCTKNGWWKDTFKLPCSKDSNNSGSTEQTGLLITGHKLNGQNYLQWSHSVMMFISGCGKDDYLIGAASQLASGIQTKEIWDAARETYSDTEDTAEAFEIEGILHDFHQAIKPLPNIREVASEVRREESRRKVMMSTNQPAPEGSALAARGPPYPANDNRKSWQCYFYRGNPCISFT
ncbi:hypothetical protein BUALT_Bualt09G0003500 [Buddleja alternifolia]|uniref:Protein kinase domain-containing protein n=1 Tax=Buddleja alternifolia TaxID=168488 RepID=A0AAV6X9H0_9LAMI|nr:hypothetical protein BUALT_Bualt09G0003500 [Buddleja alternifolia]